MISQTVALIQVMKPTAFSQTCAHWWMWTLILCISNPGIWIMLFQNMLVRTTALLKSSNQCYEHAEQNAEHKMHDWADPLCFTLNPYCNSSPHHRFAQVSLLSHRYIMILPTSVHSLDLLYVLKVQTETETCPKHANITAVPGKKRPLPAAIVTPLKMLSYKPVALVRQWQARVWRWAEKPAQHALPAKDQAIVNQCKGRTLFNYQWAYYGLQLPRKGELVQS